ncbi:hypothetical protein COV20_02380 [Candidatus Woesearchaeota archaeon CG10_big_fil_rev_8_21_14_0_10_45_16]|nr:MAG: hypothetical protein COV20_02380 [Candidatus Woesearchaeota archaeon CG10_big_fil_rev_8_21_14_0_10_45_16]
MEGTVKFFNRKKGFGFIAGDDGKEYFVHFTGLAKGTFLRDNDRVSFEGAEGDRGLKAQNVTLTQKASDRSDVPQESRGKHHEESADDTDDEGSEDDFAEDSEEDEDSAEDSEEDQEDEDKN